MKHIKLICLFAMVLIACSINAILAQTSTSIDTVDISNLSFEDLMKYKSQGLPSAMDSKINSAIEVGSVKPLIARRSPSIISSISEEEIQHSGARDLMDILNLVPGINFNSDVEGVIGISIRGIWANEGKVLLMIDGQEMNETVFGTLQFANRYPIDQIKRIEVIRGLSSSAIYGGTAEYAVINIITKGAGELDGVQVNAVYGQTKSIMARNNYTLAIGKKINDFNFSLSGFAGYSNQSDRVYTDVHGESFDMSNNSANTAYHLNLGLSYKALSFRTVYDNFYNQLRDGYDIALNNSYHQYFKTSSSELKYEWRANNKLTVIPKVSIKTNSPWEITSYNGTDLVEAYAYKYKTVADRYKFNITSVWETTKNITTTFGGEFFYDHAVKKDGKIFRLSESNSASYNNAAGFIQSVYRNKVVNVIAGARYDYNSGFGKSFVPRVGFTKRIDKFNFKLLCSSTFKAPTIENVESSFKCKIKPEKTNIYEFEASYQLNEDMFLTANVFDINTNNPIVYYSYPADTVTSEALEGYINDKKSGSKGLELEYKFVSNWGYFNLNYSYYSTFNKPMVDIYENPNSNSQVLGIGNHKLAINSSIDLTKSVYISPSMIYHSGKTGITAVDAEENFVYSKFPDTYTININLGCTHLFVKGLTASAGVYNLLDEKLYYIQTYSSGHAPLPGISREFLIKLNYHFQYH